MAARSLAEMDDTANRSPNVNEGKMPEDLERAMFFEHDIAMFRQTVSKFKGDVKSTLGHLTTVHNETCGCQIGHGSHEVANRVWNQKKVPFIELQKQSGLDFEDFLNRSLRLLMTNSLQNVQPMTEAEFWQTLRATSYQQPPIEEPKPSCSSHEAIEEDLADIHQFIANDIGSTELFLPNNNSSNAGRTFLAHSRSFSRLFAENRPNNNFDFARFAP